MLTRMFALRVRQFVAAAGILMLFFTVYFLEQSHDQIHYPDVGYRKHKALFRKVSLQCCGVPGRSLQLNFAKAAC